MKNKIKDLENFLNIEITKAVKILFKNLKNKNIDINLEVSQLNKSQLKHYNKIYNKFKKNLIEIQNRALSIFGNEKYLNFLFGIIVQEIIKKEKEL